MAIRTFEDEDGKAGDLCLVNIFRFYIRGMGGFGFKGKTQDIMPDIPTTKPNFTTEQATLPNQALLYRLSGDPNPLHVDADMAALGGFDKPILHGLCQYGVSAKIIVQKLCNHDATKLKSISVRFTSHVFPGETLVMRGWVEGASVIFEVSTKERGKVVIVGKAMLSEAGDRKSVV